MKKIYKNQDFGLADDRIVVTLNSSNSPRVLVEPMHSHEFVEISYVLAGEAKQIINGTTHSVVKGDVIILNPSDTHSIMMIEGLDLLDCLVGANVAEKLSEALSKEFHMPISLLPNVIRLEGKVLLEIDRYFHMIGTEFESGKDGSQLLMQSLLTMVFIRLFRHVQTSGGAVGEDTSARILSYVENHFETANLSMVASHFGYSNGYFSRYFKNLFGVGLITYINSLKIHRAEELIKSSNGDISVEEICNRVGFKDRKHFCSIYKEYVGYSPSEALARQRKKKAAAGKK